jgi:hypothetical protein
MRNGYAPVLWIWRIRLFPGIVISAQLSDLLSRLILEDADQQSVRKRLDELREWLELGGAFRLQTQSPRS